MEKTPINFRAWIDDHRHLLKPPIGNKQIWEHGDFIVMVVGGPNSRTDFHWEEGPEFFYQLEGEMVLKIAENDKIVDVPLKAGEIFLLPPKVPHSPQRMPNSVGLVVEQKRRPEEQDGLLWFCFECGNKLYEEYFHLENIEKQFQPVFEKYYASEDFRTCKKCGTVQKVPEKK